VTVRQALLTIALFTIVAYPLHASAQDPTPKLAYSLPIEYSYATNIFRTKLVYKLSAGIYTHENTTKEGTYLRGPANCMTVEQSSRGKPLPTISREGGIFIPAQPGSTAKMYLYPIAPGQPTPSSAELQGGPIVNAIVRYKLTNPGFPEKQKPDPVLYSLLIAVPSEL
jgi:hypothetical protein